MNDREQLDLMIHQAERTLDNLIEESAEAAELAGAFRAFIAGVKNLEPDKCIGAAGQMCPVRRYKLVYNYSSVELEVTGTLEEAEAVITAEYSALKRMSDGTIELQGPPLVWGESYTRSDTGWDYQDAPPEWGDPPLPSYQERRPSYGGGGKRPLTDKERAFARKLGMQDAFNPNIDPSAVRRWIQTHK